MGHDGCAVSRPVYEGDNTFYACVDFVEDVRYRNQPVGKLLRELPHNYKHCFLRLEDTIELPPGYGNGLAQAAILKCIPKAPLIGPSSN